MQRIRVRYTLVDRVRFVSARDLTSVWERALRRVDLPIAYSEGFSPHPKVSFPDALPVGIASTGEYAELTFAVPIRPERDLAALSSTLPEGMDITTYWEVPDGAPKLARMLPATLWETAWDADGAPGVVPEALPPALERLLAADHAEVVRRRKDKDVTFDVRPPLLDAGLSTDGDGRPILRAVLDNRGAAVRPTDLVSALAQRADQPLPRVHLHTRVAQGEHVAGGLREALGGEVVHLHHAVVEDAA